MNNENKIKGMHFLKFYFQIRWTKIQNRILNIHFIFNMFAYIWEIFESASYLFFHNYIRSVFFLPSQPNLSMLLCLALPLMSVHHLTAKDRTVLKGPLGIDRGV